MPWRPVTKIEGYLTPDELRSMVEQVAQLAKENARRKMAIRNLEYFLPPDTYKAAQDLAELFRRAGLTPYEVLYAPMEQSYAVWFAYDGDEDYLARLYTEDGKVVQVYIQNYSNTIPWGIIRQYYDVILKTDEYHRRKERMALSEAA